MLLHTAEFAPNPRRLNLFIACKGIELATAPVDMRSGATRSEAFLARNPRGIVPMLELDDGTLLCDALAIALYLEGLHPQPPLFGSDALERARIVSWDQYLFTDAFQPTADFWRNSHPAFAESPVPGALKLPQIPALAERGRSRLLAFYVALEAQLDERAYLVGERLSWADICLSAWLDFAEKVAVPVPAECPRLRARQQQLRAELPAVR